MSKEVLLNKQVQELTETNENQPPKPVEKVENKNLGIIYWCLSGFIFCLNFLCGKVLYEHHSDLGAT
jgi:hypothetical protein